MPTRNPGELRPHRIDEEGIRRRGEEAERRKRERIERDKKIAEQREKEAKQPGLEIHRGRGTDYDLIPSRKKR